MANFPSFTFTTAGRSAITRSLSGKDVDRLIITKCVLGDGVYSGGIETLKAVTSPKMTVTASEYTDNGDGTSVTRFVYDNASLDVGFSHREMGIYAKNGDSGTELLLCYSNAGNQYSYIKAGTIDSVTKQRKATMPPQTFKLVLATGGSGSVDAVIDPKGYVDVEMLEEHNTDPAAHGDKLVNLTTNGNSLRAVKGDGTNVDVVVPYAVGTTQANPKNLGNYATNKISDIRDLFNNELADMSAKGCSVRFVRLGADLPTIYNNWAKNWDAIMSPWGTIYGVISLLGDDSYANVELVGFTGTTVLLQKIAGIWKPAERKVYTNDLFQKVETELATHNTDPTAHKPIVDNIINLMYPVGIIIEFAEDVDPNATWVGTTWERMSNGRVLVSAGTSDSGTTYTLGATGGEESHKLTTDEMPEHNHYSNTESSGGHKHNRGDMNITGAFWAATGGSGEAVGSFSVNRSGQAYTAMNSNYSDGRLFDFNAANSWTGSTNTTGDHTHIIKSDGGSQAHNNMQPYEVVNRWKRTA